MVRQQHDWAVEVIEMAVNNIVRSVLSNCSVEMSGVQPRLFRVKTRNYSCAERFNVRLIGTVAAMDQKVHLKPVPVQLP
jgi:hypothetical protein